MKRLLLVLTLLSAATTALAAGDQAYLAIFAETRAQKMAGQPAMPALPPGFDLSMIPPAARAMMSGQPERILTVRLWSPSIAPDDATASLAPPEGLKVGDKLDLMIYRPKPEETSGGAAEPATPPEFTIKIYWGDSETVRPGQPRIIHFGDLSDEQKQAMQKMSAEARRHSSYFYKPGWTTAYWPTDNQPGTIAQDASLVGSYALTTNYTGSVSLDAPSNVDFLAPIDMSSPKLDQPIPLDQSIPIQWTQIPNALGLYASIVGMEGRNTIVIWSSSEVFDQGLVGDFGFLEMAQVADMVSKTVMMKGDRTSVTVPAGIFQNADMAMFNMVGYGPGAARDGVQPLPRIQTKTTLGIMLGGKRMPGGTNRNEQE